MTEINGKREAFLGKLQTRYGYAKDQALEELEHFEEACKHKKMSGHGEHEHERVKEHSSRGERKEH